MKRVSLLLLLLLGARVASSSEPFMVNKAHLLSLVEKVYVKGDSVCVVDVYSDYPNYKPVEANGEGFACVDDAARAEVFFIRQNEYFQRTEDESIIGGLAKFIIQMQTSDGLFYNFLERKNGKVQINKAGRTSYASFGWWAARAMWALGEAAVYFKSKDENMYKEIIKTCDSSIPQIDSLLKNYGRYDNLYHPTWLLYGDGGDATSELVLGLNNLYEATGNERFLRMAKELCDGMVALQSKAVSTPPYGVFYSNHDGWHGWANSQATAILEYVRLSQDSSMMVDALREVNYFLPHWSGALFFRACDAQGENLDYSEQIAYAVRPAVTAAAEAYELTHDQKYKTLACIISSWFFGNNTSRTIFYSKDTGICFDGTEDSVKVNKNSGAESTIEALLTMIELEKINADFEIITLLSQPDFVSDRYIYRIDSKKVEVKVDTGGFVVK